MADTPDSDDDFLAGFEPILPKGLLHSDLLHTEFLVVFMLAIPPEMQFHPIMPLACQCP